VGLNVNIAPESFPEDIRTRATSVFAETGKPCPRLNLLRRFLENFDTRYEELKRTGFESILTRWRALTDMVGKTVFVKAIDGFCRGKVVDFDREGYLIVMEETGRERRLLSGDVTVL